MFKLNYRRALLAILLMISPFSTRAGDIDWNGFGSVYGAQSFNADVLAPNFTDQHLNFGTFSNFGLNVGSRLSDSLTVAGQFLAYSPSSAEAWRMRANWAYLVYRPTDSTLIKLGRQLYPAFLASEYLSVGYLQINRRLPATVYPLAPFSGFDGGSVTQTIMETGIGRVSTTLVIGAPNLAVGANAGGAPNDIAVDTSQSRTADLFGLGLSLDGVGYRVQAQVNTSNIIFNVPVPRRTRTATPPFFSITNNNELLEGKPLTATAGFRVDRNDIVNWTEAIWVRNPGGTQAPTRRTIPPGPAPQETVPFVGAMFGAYTTLGYRIGDFLPRYTFGYADVEGSYVAEGELQTHIIGLNYQVNAQTVAKVEYEHNFVPKNNPYSAITSAAAPPNNIAKGESGGAAYIGVDFIF